MAERFHQEELPPEQENNSLGIGESPVVQEAQKQEIKPHKKDRFFEALSAKKSEEYEYDDDERKIHEPESLYEMEADFGLLSENHKVSKFVRERLEILNPGIPKEELPSVFVLGSKGLGINAFAGANWRILVTPETLEKIESVEELDYILLHELAHLTRKHSEKMDRPHMRDSFLKSAGVQRVSEYEADIIAFDKASSNYPRTNPMGAINFLERIRTEDNQGWDIAHGTVTDRILS